VQIRYHRHGEIDREALGDDDKLCSEEGLLLDVVDAEAGFHQEVTRDNAAARMTCAQSAKHIAFITPLVQYTTYII
jgi:hypothetical protein